MERPNFNTAADCLEATAEEMRKCVEFPPIVQGQDILAASNSLDTRVDARFDRLEAAMSA